MFKSFAATLEREFFPGAFHSHNLPPPQSRELWRRRITWKFLCFLLSKSVFDCSCRRRGRVWPSNMSFFATTSASREAMLTEKRSLERDHASRDGMSDEKRQRPTLAKSVLCKPLPQFEAYFLTLTAPSSSLIWRGFSGPCCCRYFSIIFFLG
jgi:hypothetical protein